MNIKGLKYILFCSAVLAGAQSFGQISNLMEEQDVRSLRNEKDALYFSLYSNNFFKNNEYFLNSVSGYTLFGTQNVMALTYKPNKILSLQGGVYLKKDFGTEGLAKVAPYYNLSLSKNGYSLSFGNYGGHINHRMLDPMFGYERLMTNYLENGIQLKVNKRSIYSELWIDWEKQQYYNVNYNERFTIGNNTRLRIFHEGGTSLSIPVQVLASHNGGQLDTTNSPTVTLFNAAVGLDITQKISSRTIKSIGLNAYYLYYKDLAGNSDLAYKNGSGMYANLNVQFQKGFYATAGYWQGKQFIAPKGGVLFQSLSYNPGNPDLLTPDRKMVMLGLAYQKKIMPQMTIDVRLEPFYDIGNKRLDYSYALFLTYQPHFLLKRNLQEP
ncbi:hypothetical protein DBR32_09615 [Taibaiella sp. KBW10]|uniref:hypothetical protein n=1 Tax=Taibaiella sp. KBW10 TaxID=2153357 RepID=UPI000F5B00CE|nr:hypothetical protein [Taibaiella sp. KBW10]RQO30956.1 hypothetical protein DBR32_09615 [Taibaiella sp. KBW10]